MMLRRRTASLAPFLSNLRRSTPSISRIVISPRLSSSSAAAEQAAGVGNSAGTRKKRSLGRQLCQVGLISLAGGFFLSAINDIAIFNGCSSKAIEKASQNRQIVESLGLPIVRGPWYDASLAVGYRRHSVSSTFPVSGPHGTGIIQMKALRQGEDTTFSFLKHHDWDILVLEALLHVPSNDEKQQTIRVSVTGDGSSLDATSESIQCKLQPSSAAAEK